MGYVPEIYHPRHKFMKATTMNTSTSMIINAGRWAGMVGIGSDIKVDVNGNFNGLTTKMKSNTGKYPTMVVI